MIAHPIITGITDTVKMSLVNAIHVRFLKKKFRAEFEIVEKQVTDLEDRMGRC